jgi:hypothetical protein
LRAVAANHHEGVDLALAQIGKRLRAPWRLGELGAASAAEHGSAGLHDAADVARQ